MMKIVILTCVIAAVTAAPGLLLTAPAHKSTITHSSHVVDHGHTQVAHVAPVAHVAHVAHVAPVAHVAHVAPAHPVLLKTEGSAVTHQSQTVHHTVPVHAIHH